MPSDRLLSSIEEDAVTDLCEGWGVGRRAQLNIRRRLEEEAEPARPHALCTRTRIRTKGTPYYSDERRPNSRHGEVRVWVENNAFADRPIVPDNFAVEIKMPIISQHLMHQSRHTRLRTMGTTRSIFFNITLISEDIFALNERRQTLSSTSWLHDRGIVPDLGQ